MITIQIGKEDWAIDSDDMQWILYQKAIVQKGKNEGEEVARYHSYFSSLEGLFHCLFEKKLRNKDYDSIAELLQEIKKVKEELTGMYSANIIPAKKAAKAR